MQENLEPDTERTEGPVPVDVFHQDLLDAIEESDTRWLARALSRLHPADAADTLEQLSLDSFNQAVELLGADFSTAVLIELRDEYRESAVARLPDGLVASVLDELDSDDATAILEDMAEDRRARVLGAMAPRDRAALASSLAFEEETAGRIMQREFVAVAEFWTVGETIDHARDQGDRLPEQFYEIYVVDPSMHIKGVVALSMLLRAERDTALADIMLAQQSDVRAEMDQEEVAYQFQKYSLAQAPVMDADGRIIGIITVDDMVDVIQDENTEDLLALSNVRSADPSDTVAKSVQARAPWLAVNLVTAFMGSGVISLFEDTLNAVVQLAILMPMVSALGGNAGSQALAVAVRAIAEREMEGAAQRRAVTREILTGICNGLLFAVLVALIVLFWFRDPTLSFVVGLAMIATFTWAGLSGILVPLTLRKLGFDPAVASSVFVLTSIDILAFFCFLGLASIILL